MKAIQYIKTTHYLNRAAFASGAILFLLAIAMHLPISNGEQETQAAGKVTDGTMTMEIINDTASVDLSVTDSSGSFATSSADERASFNVSTDSIAGYTLSISSDDDSGELTNGEDKLDSINTAISASTFDNAAYNGTWGYQPSKYDSVTNTNFLPSPTTYDTVLDVTDSSNVEANPYTIALGARADYEQATGSYNKTLTINAVANIVPTLCDNTKLCVQYNANGLHFLGLPDANNRVNYDSTISTTTTTKYSHTSNVNDAGTQNGNYPNDSNTNDVVTIDGASSLHVKITYATESTSYDWAVIWAGKQSSYTADNDYSSGITCGGEGPKLGDTTETTVECDVTGDSVTFGFYSDSSVNDYYGYYAVVTGTSTTGSRTVSSGEYITPTGTNAVFYGWSSTQTTAGGGLPSQVEYADESAVISNIPGNNGDTKTLYAVWRQDYPITFTKDSNTTSLAVLDVSGNTVGTITDSGQSLILYQGSTYTIKPTHTTGYATDTITKTTGAGTISGGQFTVGSGAATISVTSRAILPMQNYNCSNLANIGDTDMVYDTRDGEAYLIGKLADNKCWLLDNLRLDLVAHKNDLNSTNTNATNEQLAYLKGTSTGTSSDQWAMSGVSYWTSSYSYSAPWIAIKNTSDENWNPDTTTTSYGAGSGEIGVYYNYCAASAGTYCWGNGTSYTGSPSSDPKTNTGYDIDGDICPAGWRMPTGGAIATGTVAKGEYQSLANAITGGTSSSLSGNNATAFKSALSTPLSGRFNNGSASYQGSYGYFWSSTWGSSTNMYNLNANSSNVYLQDYNSRSYGYSVRCVLMPTTTYTLNYNQNTTDTVSNMPSSQSTTIQDDRYGASLTLPTGTIPSRSGYTFAGWGTSSDQEIPTYKYENGSFTPSEAIVSTSDNPKTLYAIWYKTQDITFTFDSNVTEIAITDPNGDTVATISSSGTTVSLINPLTYTIKPTHTTGYTTNTTTKSSGAGTLTSGPTKSYFKVGDGSATINITSRTMLPMQNYNCSNLANVGDTDMVYDTRDGEAYLIGKLADNKCWLLDNLRLDLGDSTVLSNITADNTNASATELNYLKNGGGTTSDQYPTAKINNVAWTSSSQNYHSIPMTVSAHKDTIASVTYGEGSGEIGVYYNYCAASAGTYCWGNGTSSTGSPLSDPKTNTGYDIDGDICPAGWRMPTGGAIATGTVAKGEYQSLANAITGGTSSSLSGDNATAFKSALSTPLSGHFSSGSASNQGSTGSFWSSTWNSSYYMYHLYVSSSGVSPRNNSYKDNGYPVRCVLMPTTTYTLNYDQNTTDTVSNMPSSQSVAVQDDRGHDFTLPTSAIPSRSGYTFAGWGTSSGQQNPIYRYENGLFTPSEVTIYANDNTKSLYAIWQIPHTITFTKDSGVSSVEIIDSEGNTIDTITSSSATLTLGESLTYTIKPSLASDRSLNAITLATGVGTISGKNFTVGSGSATISITSKAISPIQNWNGCSSFAVGDTEVVYDTRDNEFYLVGKLADNKCWMLDNLRLDLGDSTVLDNTTASNTNASATALNYLKNGGGTTSNKWPTAKINYDEWMSSFHNYYSIPMTVSSGNGWTKDTTTTSYGEGSGKIGVYYNYCAASAGTYCWGNGTSSSGSPYSDPKTNTGYDIDGDICPAGWRMPTGGAIATGTVAKGEYQSLANAITGGTSSSLSGDNASAFRNHLSTPLSGYYDGYMVTNRGSSGYFWSSTWYSGGQSNTLYVNASNVYPTTSYDNLNYGLPVRCVLK